MTTKIPKLRTSGLKKSKRWPLIGAIKAGDRFKSLYSGDEFEIEQVLHYDPHFNYLLKFDEPELNQKDFTRITTEMLLRYSIPIKENDDGNV